jgi:hypothetical protein
MKSTVEIAPGRFLINYGDGRTVYKDPRHQVIETRKPDGSLTELVMVKQANGSYIPQILSIRNPDGRVLVLEEMSVP